MNNVLLDPLPEKWNGYKVNTWFQVGVQIFIIQYDKSLADWEKTAMVTSLMFEDEDTGEIREHPSGEELNQCVEWYLNGWFHDRPGGETDNRRLLDFDVDQWRIYADFRQIYGINLNESDMHFWEFMGLLWNMPYKYSSFMQVIDIRKKKIRPKMSKEEKASIREAQRIYGLGEAKPEKKREYTPEEVQRMDEVDRLRASMKIKKQRLRAEYV